MRQVFYNLLIDDLPFRIKTINKVVAFPNIGYHISERIDKGKKMGIFHLGACEVAGSLQARLGGLDGLWDGGPNNQTKKGQIGLIG